MGRCARCGFELGRKDEYCTNCGARVARSSQKGKKRASAGSTALIVALAVVAAIAVVVAVASAMTLHQEPSKVSAPLSVSAGESNRPSDDSSLVASPSSARAGEKESTIVPKANREIAEAPIVMMPSTTYSQPDDERVADDDYYHDLLKAYYDAAGAYDAEVERVAEEFNDNYLKKAREDRQELAESAQLLEEEIVAVWDDLEGLGLDDSSKYYDTWRDVCTLYECLWHRIDVIVQAWEISLSYDNPKSHKDEILEPIAADVEAGDNKYYAKFKELYPEIDL